MKYIVQLFVFITTIFIFSGCSSNNGNGFHLRNKVTLADSYQHVAIEGLDRDSQQFKALKFALQEAGSVVSQQPDETFSGSIIKIQNVREGRRVVAYTSERKVREYLLYLKFDYFIVSQKQQNSIPKKQRINLDRSFLYDVNFVLGKTEEERQIRKTMYQEAARLILLKMQATK